ncbi:MAG: outer membrane protein assembly factor BamD [Phycisphaerales bacterium]
MPRPLALIHAILLSLAITGAARAQSDQYILKPDGTWTQAHTPEPGSDAATIAEARKAIADNRPDAARGILDRWLEANERSGKPEVPEALRLRGDAHTAMNREDRGLRDYESLIQKFPQSEEYITALEREFEIAKAYAYGKKALWFGFLRVENGGPLAEEIFIRIQERLPGSELAERAGIELADYYFRDRDLVMAGEMYTLYLTLYPEGPNRRKAMERRVFASVGRFRGPQNDVSGLLDAKEQVRIYAMQYPEEAERQGLDQALVVRLNESLAAQMLETANWYLRRDDEPSARLTLKRLIARYPSTQATTRALEIIEEYGWAPKPEPAPEAPAPAERTPAPKDPEPAATPEGSN